MNIKAGHKELTSRSPFGKDYHIASNGGHKIGAFLARNKGKKVVVIQGLGFVGSAMLTAVASAQGKDGLPLYA
ncbi:MAG: hypothetical protein WAW13_05430, partial [Minisyncoccia bacterium]